MNKQRMFDEFVELATTDAASRNEKEVADKLWKKLNDLGFVTEWDNAGETFDGNTGNIFAYREGERDGVICFCSHMDRVPNGLGIVPEVREGNVMYSAGDTILAADDLSGVVSILEGARLALENGTPLPRIEILFTVGEESGLNGAKAFDLSKVQSDIIYLLDSPGHYGRINNGAPGRSMIEVQVHGKAAHAGNEPEKGIDAAKIMAEMLASIRTGRIDEITTSNFSYMWTKSASAMNVVCDHAILRGEMRSREKARLDAYEAHVKEVCSAIAEKRGATVEFHREDTFLPFFTPEDTPAVQLLAKAYAKLNTEMVVTVGGGGMDGNIFAAKGKSCVGVASGYFANHTSDEHLFLDDFYNTGELIRTIIELA